MSKWIKFLDWTEFNKRRGTMPKTRSFCVSSVNGEVRLGEVKWYSPWRRYVFYPQPDTLLDQNCLQDIVDFIGNLMEERKLRLKT